MPMVLAASSAAAAAVSTTAASAFVRLVTFCTGMKILNGYSMCTYVVHEFLYWHVLYLLLHPAMHVPFFVDLDGGQYVYLNNTYGFIRHGICVVKRYVWNDFSGRYDIIRSE